MKIWIQSKMLLLAVLSCFLLAGCGEDSDNGYSLNNLASSNSDTLTIGANTSTTQSGDWVTMQGNAGHTGYVPVDLDTDKFTKIWDWTCDALDITGINPVAVSNGKVYISTDVYHKDAYLYALDEQTGQEAWRYAFGVMPQLNPPATGFGSVFVTTSGHSDTFIWRINETNGQLAFKTPFASQWPSYFAPTVYDTTVYTNCGYYRGEVCAFSIFDGASLWSASAGSLDMTTPAVNASGVFYYSGTSLEVWNPETGASDMSISDPSAVNYTYSYIAAPILGGQNNIIAYSGSAWSGSSSSSIEHDTQRYLLSFDLQTETIDWTSSYMYLTHPAVANHVVYAGRNEPMSFDAIDETTGSILWSWSPEGLGDTSFHRNIIATNNLVFVSTDKNVYALDIATHQPVWSYPEPGTLALTGNGTLFISPDTYAYSNTSSDGRLIAISVY